ncbi:MAG: hypothetical protein NVSMB52_02600 [Chloroflexota bacterium]
MSNGCSRGPMTISSRHAAAIARHWIAQYRQGIAIEIPDQFPGYYTVHLHKSGTIAGGAFGQRVQRTSLVSQLARKVYSPATVPQGRYGQISI